MSVPRPFLALLFVALLLTAPALAQTPKGGCGDRGNDPNITFPDSLLVQNGGPILNVKNPPSGIRAAKGDGTTDDTAALRSVYDFLRDHYTRTKGWSNENVYYVYLPNGTYRVSDTLIYRGKTVGAYPKWDGTFDFNHLRFIGQNRAKTVIRLADNAPGFGDPKNPKYLLCYQHPDTVFNNLPGGNYLRNITLSVGRGNRGAVGLYMQGANNTDMRNVTVKSEDRAGKYGIFFRVGSIQGYYCDVTVEGFDVGIFDTVNPEGDPAFEYLTLRNQNSIGILHTGGGMSLRKVLSDQRESGAQALKLDGSGVQNVMLDSQLMAKALSVPAIEMTRNEEQCLFVRDVTTSGYRNAIIKAGKAEAPNGPVREYVSYPAKTVDDGRPPTSLRLPIQDTPAVPWFDPAKEWAIAEDYPSVQAAFDSGKPVVCFKKRSYKLPGDVRVPKTVRFVNMLGANVEGGAFVIAEPSPNPILFQDSSGSIRFEAVRDVIQRCAGGGVSNPKNLPVTLYLENVNDNATGDEFCPSRQKTYARQIDIEYGQGNQIVCNGGLFWIFGFKTENAGAIPFTAKNGGSLEVLGGYANATNQKPTAAEQNPWVRVNNANVSLTMFSNLSGPFLKAIEQTGADGKTAIVPNTDFPRRGYVYRDDYVIPLYISRARK